MAGTKRVTVSLEGKETVSGAARRAGDAVGDLENKGRSLGETWAVAVTGVNQALELMGKAAQLVGQIYDQAKIGAQASQVRQAFESMADGAGMAADRMIADLRRASANTVAEMELMSSANRALLFEIPAEQLDELMGIARASATATGASVQQMFDDIVTGIGRASPMILDNLGLTLRIGEANEAYAESLGKASTDLTSAEKKQAILNATLEAGEDLMNRVGDAATELTDLERMQQFESAWTDFKVVVGEVLTDVFTPMLDTTARMLVNITNAIRESRALYQQLEIVKSAGAGGVAETDLSTALNATEQDIRRLVSKVFRDFTTATNRVGDLGYEIARPDEDMSVNQLIRYVSQLPETPQTRDLSELVEQFKTLLSRQEQQELQAQYGGLAPAPPGITDPSTGTGDSDELTTGLIGAAITAMMDPMRRGLRDVIRGMNEEVEKEVQLLDLTGFGDQYSENFNMIMDSNQSLREFQDSVSKASKALDTEFKHSVEEMADARERMERNIPRDAGAFGAPVDTDGQLAFGASGINDLMNGFGDIIGQAGQLAMSFSSIVALADPVAIFLQGLNDSIGSLVNSALAPLIGIILQIGKTFGAYLRPMIEGVAWILEKWAQLWVWAYNTVFVPIFNGFMFIFNVLQNVFWNFAQVLTNVVNGIIDIHNALRRSKFHIDHVSNPAGSKRGREEGFVDTISFDDMVGAGNDYTGNTSTSDNTTVSRPPDIHIYQTFQGPIIGTAGLAEVGEFMGEALIAYTGIGGRLIFEDNAGNQETVGVVA
jgi:hypothetical protein